MLQDTQSSFPVLIEDTRTPDRWVNSTLPVPVTSHIAEGGQPKVLKVAGSKWCCRYSCCVMSLLAIWQAVLMKMYETWFA